MEEPKIKVGIMSAAEVHFTLDGQYSVLNKTISGSQVATTDGNVIIWNNEKFEQLEFVPVDENLASFELKDVTIGVNFHWERKETQRFKGALRLIVEHGKITPVNILGVEDYLLSVISSEMSATASLELLKAHAVISRSWLLAQIDKNKRIEMSGEKYVAAENVEGEMIKWYDREDHVNFDVCADDHCQRYQGISKQSSSLVRDVIKKTRGQIMMYDEIICDTRFSKCCGGFTETFENVWQDKPQPYLVGKADTKNITLQTPNLSNEEEAINWIKSSPVAFCNTKDAKVLKQVLNDYDQETSDFYRWNVTYSQEEISELIYKRSGIDYGDILALLPIQRGTSGRIVRLKIIGTQRIMIIGKELEIRRTLSESHLYSSAFVIEQGKENEEGIPSEFTLYGAGWGHGVGLCQIGAAVMANRGYEYEDILEHYYPGAEIEIGY